MKASFIVLALVACVLLAEVTEVCKHFCLSVLAKELTCTCSSPVMPVIISKLNVAYMYISVWTALCGPLILLYMHCVYSSSQDCHSIYAACSTFIESRVSLSIPAYLPFLSADCTCGEEMPFLVPLSLRLVLLQTLLWHNSAYRTFYHGYYVFCYR